MIAVTDLRARRAMAFLAPKSRGARRRSLLLSSAAGLALAALPTPAQAACAPDPTLVGGTTICTGLDSDGLSVPTARTTVRVAPAAIVGGAGATARPINWTGADGALFVDGTVDGRSMNPIGAAALFSGTRPRVIVTASGAVFGLESAVRYNPGSSGGTITIDNSGRIEAVTTAIQLQSNPQAVLNLTNRAGAIVGGATGVGATTTALSGAASFITLLDNAGTITGTSGAAVDLTASPSLRGSVGTLVNRAAGRFNGGIVASNIAQLANAGTIDGGARSAVDSVSTGSIFNSGSITSRRTDGATVVLAAPNIENRGTIANGGGGAAISASSSGTLFNTASGTISSTGATAVRMAQGGQLINAGRIVGDVDLTGAFAATVTQRGSIQGSVRFGASNDTFLVDAGAVTTGTGVTGSIDAGGGAGIDSFGYTTTGTASVVLGLLPATFEQFVLEAQGDGVLSASGSIGATALTSQGTGTVISAVDITRTGTSAINAFAGRTVNRGTIDFTGAIGASRSNLVNAGTLVNEGVLIARGVNTRIVANGSSLDNRGSIRLAERAVFSGPSGTINNQGVIAMSADSQLFEDSPFATRTVINSGTIAAGGTAIAAAANGSLTVTNSGAIRSGGRAIDFSAQLAGVSGSILNSETGLIEGVGTVILGGLGSDTVTNNGRIIGNVELGAGNDIYQGSGRLEGNLLLGDGNDIYVIDVAAPGVVTGTIDAGAGIDTRRLLARSSTVVDAAADGRFEVTDLVVSGAASGADRPAVSNRTALTTAGSTAVNVSGNVAFSNLAALSASGAAGIALRSGSLSTSINEANIIVTGGAVGVRQDAGLGVNRGLIGGNGSGLALGGGRFDNNGRISTTGPTVQFNGVTGRVNNSGLIEAATGPAVTNGTGSITFRNLETGVVRGGTGGVAIQGGNSSELVFNAGRIVGDVSLGAGNDTYQYAGGVIEGRLLLGTGSDRVDVGLRGFDVTLATGGVDAGDGDDYYIASFDTSRSIDLVRVTGFEGIGINTINASDVVTTNAGAAGAAPLDLLVEAGGTGTVINNRALARAGNVLQSFGAARLINRADVTVTGAATGTQISAISSNGYISGSPPSVVNDGVVRATGATAVGLLSQGTSLPTDVIILNNGTVSATGGATALVVNGGVLRNAGNVSTDNRSTAAVVNPAGRLVNDGRILTATSALQLVGGTLVNGGTLAATNGNAVQASGGRIVNTGSISAASNDGIAATSAFAMLTIVNDATGTIAGSFNAIGANGGAEIRIANRGDLQGNVAFQTNTGGSGGNRDVFWSDGGRVGGSVVFASSDDLFITDIANAANPRVGITGTLDMGAGEDTLRLRATASTTTAVLPTATGFERIGYEAVGRNTVLTLTNPGATLTGLELTGDGSIDLTANFRSVGTALTLGSNSTAALFAETSTTPSLAPRVVSRGSIISDAGANLSTSPAVLLSNSERFENAGTILLVQAPGASLSRAAVSGTGVMVNSGSIEIGEFNIGVTGGGLLNLTNSGRITQVEGTSATGVANVSSLDNSGTISVGGTAVSASRVINSGTIESVLSTAVSSSTALVNSTTGRIATRPGATAVFAGGLLINAGTIDGDVAFGSGSDVFINAGGTINGNVSLGFGDDTYLVRGTAVTPTGGVTQGTGRDAFGRSFTASASYVLDKPADYDLYAVEAAGTATTITVTSPATVAGGLRVFGTGTVDSSANITLANDSGNAAIELRRLSDTLDDPSLRFINRGNVTSSGVGVRNLGDTFVTAGVARFENSGTIDARFQAVDLAAVARADGITAVNSGTLRSTEGAAVLGLRLELRTADRTATTLPTVDVTNSGTIANRAIATSGLQDGADLYVLGGALRVANSGTIETAGAQSAALDLTASQLTLTNTGRIIATGGASEAVGVQIFREDASFNLVPVTTASVISNDGLILASGGTRVNSISTSLGEIFTPSTALSILSSGPLDLRNTANGTIEATGDRGVALAFGSIDSTRPSTLTITNAGTIRGNGGALSDFEVALLNGATTTGRALAGAIYSANAVDTVTNAATGRIVGGIDLGAGDDSLENFGRIEGDIRFGTGNDRFVQALAGALVGTADGGEGTDSLVLDVTGGGIIDFRQFVSFENIMQRGRGTVTFAGLDVGAPLPIATFDLADTSFTLAAGQTFATRSATALQGSAGSESVTNAGTINGDIDLGGGNDGLVNSGTINGIVNMGAGDDSVTNSGRITGSVLLGAGADRYTTNGTSTVGGAIDGGDGVDTFEFAVAGTPAAPTVWNGTGPVSFETLLLSSGTLSLAGTTPAFATANITGGYLVGQAGSVLSAQTINVAAGATFGTSGRVVGNLNVGGTLSPGSSPGTMTVTGNVALASGSTTLFELTPTVSDLLLVSGTTTIASGATLNVTGTRAVSATPLDLIVSDGGITGSFTTVNRGAGVFGFVAQRGNRLQLVSQFATDPAFGASARAAIDYVNTAIAGGPLSASLSAALPSLLTAQGGSAADRFAELTPEAYATATTYGASRALLLADTLRTAAVGEGEGAGTYVFAAGLAEWSDADGGAAAKAEFETRGIVGGAGHRFESGSSVAAFVGTLGGDAKTDALRARTDVDSVAFGVYGRLQADLLAVDATVAYEKGRGKLSRAVTADASTPRSRFDLDGLVADLSASYRAELGTTWTLAPRIGLTYVSIDRQAASETGGAFALTTAGDRNNLLFGNLGIEARGRFEGVEPYATIGVRHRLDGREPIASGQFGGLTGTPLSVVGAPIGRTVASVGGGASVALSPSVKLSGGYEAKLGDRDGHAVTLGLKAGF